MARHSQKNQSRKAKKHSSVVDQTPRPDPGTGNAQRELAVDVVPDPYDPEYDLEVLRFRGGLATLHGSGTIDDDMLLAGAHFQAHFEICGYSHVTTVKLDDTGRGSGGIDQHMHRTQHSRNIVNKYLKVLGWPHTQHSKAAWWIIGHGRNLEEIAKLKDLHDLKGCADKAYWRGMTVCALQIMAMHYQGRMGEKKNKRSKYQSLRSFDDSEIVVPQKNCIIET